MVTAAVMTAPQVRQPASYGHLPIRRPLVGRFDPVLLESLGSFAETRPAERALRTPLLSIDGGVCDWPSTGDSRIDCAGPPAQVTACPGGPRP